MTTRRSTMPAVLRARKPAWVNAQRRATWTAWMARLAWLTPVSALGGTLLMLVALLVGVFTPPASALAPLLWLALLLLILFGVGLLAGRLARDGSRDGSCEPGGPDEPGEGVGR